MRPETVDEYAAAIVDGKEFPEVVVFYDGADHWLADGFHRLLAHEKAGLVDILAEVRPGTKRDALLFAVGANASHGLPRTNKDKRRAVEILLRDEEWAGKSDRQVADKAAVHHELVGSVRRATRDQLADSANCGEPDTRTGKDGKQYPTRKAKPAAPPIEDAPPPPPPAPARHPVLDEIDGAADLRALDAAFNRVALAGLSEDDSDAAGEAYRRRSSELRAQAAPAPVPVAPPPSTTPKAQAALFADALAAAPPSDAGEVEALRAEVAAYRAWIASLRERAEHLPVLVKNSTPNLDRARKLVELAGSPNENEARSAAMQACRMIREQGIRLASDNPLVSSDPLDLALRGLYDAARRAGVVL
jgi:ParB-like chromosome segregation protein Spo0J